MHQLKNRFWRLATAIFLLFAGNISHAQTAVQHRVFMFGNLADVKDKPAFLSRLNQVFSETGSPFTLVLNGDLVKRKIGKNDNDDQLEPIRNLADLVQKYPFGHLIIVPGDRDWNSGKPGGEKSLQHLEDRVKKYLKKQNYDRCHWAVSDGCPGPEVFEMGDGLVILALNTQWWNHPYDKPRPSDALCDGLTEENLKEAVEDLVEEYQDRNVLMVGHHPVYSFGNYGGYFSVGDQLKPFPVIGSFRTAFHANAGNQFDLANPRLHVFIESMKNLLYFHDNLIYASGHEQNQQILTFGQNYLINSGAPEKAGFAAKDKSTTYSASEAGVMQISYFNDGRVDAGLLENGTSGGSFTLFETSCGENSSDGAFKNTAYVPCKSKLEKTAQMAQKYPGQVETIAGPEYKAGWWKRIWFGKHYRTTWTTPVITPYLDMDTTFAGLTIYKKGGGRQTTSLKFKSGNGTVYTFRSVNKDPTKALNYLLRNTIAADVVRDQTSTQHPYGAMAVAPLLDRIDILHVNPVLYRLPDDPKLGPFRPKYGNLFGMLEENPSKKNKEGKRFGGADKIEHSTDVFDHFYKKQKTRVAQEEFVRARLFDILIGDWSKHEDNWKWAAYKQEDGFRLYRPIPRDRDHAFSRQDGVINWLADRPFGIQNIENFGYKFTGIRSLTFQARHMDRFLMQEAPRSVFMEQAKYIQEHISEADIERAVANMPPEVYEKSGKEVEAKLKNRIKSLHEATAEYYKLLSREVDVTGSKEEEYFLAEHQADGTLRVRIYDTDGNAKGTTLLYERTFYPNETKEVRLWGLGNEDIFDITGGKGKIKVRAFGGPGDDVFQDHAAAKTLLYDKGDKTKYELKGGAKVVNHWNKKLYEYDRQRFAYNYYLPLIYASYSNVTGFGVNLGYHYTIRNFEKDSYHSTHALGFGLTTEGNVRASYAGRFHQTIRRWDLLVNASADDPVVRNRFFGVGNDSENLEDEFGTDYYQSEISIYRFSLGLARDFWQKSSFKLRAGIEQDESQKVENTFLNDNFQNIYGAHQKLTMVPLKVSLDLDFRDKKGLPYRGTRALLSYQNSVMLDGNGDASNNFGIARGDLEYYLSTRKQRPVTLGFRAGGAASHGDVPWYKLPSLGSTNGLRGYVEERYAGEASAFFNAELRYQFLEKQTSIVPIKAGIKAFYDYGRVFQGGLDESNDWRSGYGFGLYLVPLDESLTFSLTFGFSDEESVYPIFSIGTPLR